MDAWGAGWRLCERPHDGTHAGSAKLEHPNSNATGRHSASFADRPERRQQGRAYPTGLVLEKEAESATATAASAALRHQGIVMNGKKLRRLMRGHDLQQKRRRHYRQRSCRANLPGTGQSCRSQSPQLGKV